MARNFLELDASTDDFTAGADMTSAYKGNVILHMMAQLTCRQGAVFMKLLSDAASAT